MNDGVFRGRLVRLEAIDPEEAGKLLTGWGRDSEYMRLLDSDPARLTTPKQVQSWLEKNQDQLDMFIIRTLADDRPVGQIELGGYDWVARNAWMAVGIGEREYWGKGYGTDAMRILFRYAFRELNLNRVSLTVFEYNPRAIRSYEKLGFQPEGRERLWLNREGRRWDLLYMGLLRREWEALEQAAL